MVGRLGTLTLTDNRSTLVSARWGRRPRGGGRRAIDVRVQRLFVTAPETVLRALAEVCLGRASEDHHRQVRRWFDARLASAGGPGPRPPLPPPRPRGRVWDLEAIRADLERRFFDRPLDLTIGWGRGRSPTPRRVRSIQLGCWVEADRRIRIHPVLDREAVPLFVVEAVVYHEMLHAVLPVEEAGGRRRVHTAEFRRRERLYPHLERAEHWLDEHVFRLLRRGS